MHTNSLVPKLKTTVIGLGARLADVKSRVDQRSVRLVRSLPVVVAKAYAVHKTKKHKTKKQIYNGLVQPHLDYCSVVWQEGSRELHEEKSGEGAELWHEAHSFETS